MDIYEYRIWERRYWRGHITHWVPIFATSDLEALEVVKTRVDQDALIANADIPSSVPPLDQIRTFAAYGRQDAGVYVYDFCPDCSEPYAVRGTSPVAESHQCAVAADG
ncbi:MAG: hypothetical protein F4Z35_09170 [Dehalococcoidia bacterium]|nr:hypothetical protein [Dehalococcoidia bacterium]